jgi:hypothetical protein|tara:strand:- start:194 stop:520 length:327 start_codon:yes stop_codon:yes gene_type:complete
MKDSIDIFLRIAIAFLITMLIMTTGCNAQNVYVTKYPWQADKLIYVTDYKYQADERIFVTEYNWQVDNNIWKFVRYEWQADMKIYYVDYKYLADMKIYFVKRRHERSK